VVSKIAEPTTAVPLNEDEIRKTRTENGPKSLVNCSMTSPPSYPFSTAKSAAAYPIKPTLRIVTAIPFKLPLTKSLANKEIPKKIHRMAAVGRNIQVKEAMKSATVKSPREDILSFVPDSAFLEEMVDDEDDGVAETVLVCDKLNGQ
jgi:hypothetical protein